MSPATIAPQRARETADRSTSRPRGEVAASAEARRRELRRAAAVQAAWLAELR